MVFHDVGSRCTLARLSRIHNRMTAASRDLLLATLWLRTVRRFQQDYLAALAGDDLPRAALDAALHTMRWSRQHLIDARVLLLYRQEDLATRWPTELGAQLDALDADVARALRSYTTRRFGDDGPALLRRVTLALVDVPYAAARHLLAGEPPPPELDDLVAATCRCLLDLDGAS